MPRAIPTLGYRSRSEAVLALQAKGLSDLQIAAEIGIPKERVSALATSGWRARRPAEAAARTVVVPIETLEALRPAALARGISLNVLVRQLLEHIVDDKLVGAILDDGRQP